MTSLMARLDQLRTEEVRRVSSAWKCHGEKWRKVEVEMEVSWKKVVIVKVYT